MCGYEYDPEVGDPENGIPAGTEFEDLPEDWVCPLCGVGKDEFVPADDADTHELSYEWTIDMRAAWAFAGQLFVINFFHKTKKRIDKSLLLWYNSRVLQMTH